jgi:hypothetical protein
LTDDQNLDLQRAALKAAACGEKSRITGTARRRHGALAQAEGNGALDGGCLLISYVRTGSILLVKFLRQKY